MRQFILLSIFLFSFLGSHAQQGPQIKFGKNRVQYHDDFDEWLMYESQNFITYWYGKGRFIGQATVQLAELDFEEIQNLLEHRLNNKIEIIVYTDLTDLKQSNIGSEEAFENTGGQTKIVGNKMFIHFDGNHNHLRKKNTRRDCFGLSQFDVIRLQFAGNCAKRRFIELARLVQRRTGILCR